MNDIKLLYTVKEIFEEESFLQKNGVNYYNIPHYQRGYKWEPANVEKLLDDIYNAHLKDDKFYCVQNITITKKNDCYNVIDGQQRLTTLTLILAYLGDKTLVHNKVRFPENSIRKYTNKILNEWITSQDFDFYNAYKTWEELIQDHPEYDLQDIAHIYSVAIAIKNWFERLRSTEGSSYVESFVQKLHNNVKLIVNDVEGTQSEEKIFANLNSKRIPLDGADLIRAILITRVAREEAKEEADLKNIIFVNERRIKLGWELDQIYNWWSEEDKKVYFERFISIDSELVGNNKLFNKDIHPINFLYLLYAESAQEKELSLSFIENNENALVLYKSILHMHNTLSDWFSDRNIYHLLGYVFSNAREHKDVNFAKIWKLWNNCSTREQFIEELKSIIKLYFVDEEEIIDFKDMGIDWYNDRQNVLVKTLLLLDVIESLKPNKAYLPPKYFKKNLDDIEHIFPQNPKGKTNKEIIEYTLFLQKIGVLKQEEVDLNTLAKTLEDEYLKEDFLQLLESKTDTIKTNSIGNLVLLHRSLNRGLGNKVYEQKRSKIISYHNAGNFIQPHTFKVFVRDFVDNTYDVDYSDKEYWLQSDIENNAKYIHNQTLNFFKNKS
ncbi:DUF262 domain-containing protein [Faecalibacter sp. LW9]|uniref:DUF262 domain-containing protein n=1 Tax=Faecalibacter sp. LW9 TaxID=3103144 RepID=UPI002B000DE6|nr:DUF262 domain-containing protein [Faecalibacter sp. LW9]